MFCCELKTADEVRTHARIVQQRINARRRLPDPERRAPESPPALAPEPEPPAVPEPRWEPPWPGLSIPDSPVRSIMRIAAHHHGMSLPVLLSDNREKSVNIPRQIGFYVAHRLLGASLSKIGRAARRDHSTVLSGCRAIEQRLAANRLVAEAINAVGEKAAAAIGTHWEPVGP